MKLEFSKSKELENLVLLVKSCLKKLNIDAPFYIAGGSVFTAFKKKKSLFDNLINNTDDSSAPDEDIDVWFYNDKDINELVNRISDIDYMSIVQEIFSVHITDNAVSLNCESPKNTIPVHSDISEVHPKHHNSSIIQFIKLRSGSPDEIMSHFDISCSKIAFTSDNRLIKHKDFSEEFKVSFSNISSDIFRRYIKYTEVKGAKDKNSSELINIIEYFILNWDKEYTGAYENPSTTLGIDVLFNGAGILLECSRHDGNFLILMISDMIDKTHDSETRMSIYSSATSWKFIKFGLVDNPSDEYVVSRILNIDEILSSEINMSKSNTTTTIDDKLYTFVDLKQSKYGLSALSKYPEFFI